MAQQIKQNEFEKACITVASEYDERKIMYIPASIDQMLDEEGNIYKFNNDNEKNEFVKNLLLLANEAIENILTEFDDEGLTYGIYSQSKKICFYISWQNDDCTQNDERKHASIPIIFPIKDETDVSFIKKPKDIELLINKYLLQYRRKLQKEGNKSMPWFGLPERPIEICVDDTDDTEKQQLDCEEKPWGKGSFEIVDLFIGGRESNLYLMFNEEMVYDNYTDYYIILK